MSQEEAGKVVSVGIAWYRPDQWARLLEISIDRDALEDTYAEWEKGAAKSLSELQSRGVLIEKVDMDVEVLREWCLDNGLLVDASARSNFVSERLRRKHEGL